MINKTNGVDTRPVAVGAGTAVPRTRDADSDNAQSAVAQAVEGVQITDGARQLAALEHAIAEVPVVSQERVDNVSRAINEGRYQVRAEKIADKMLRLDQTLTQARRSAK